MKPTYKELLEMQNDVLANMVVATQASKDVLAVRITELEQRESELMAYAEMLEEFLTKYSDYIVEHAIEYTGEDLSLEINSIFDQSPQTCLAEHDAQVIEKAQKYVIQFFPRRADSIHAGLKQYANNLSNQAKDGE